MMIKKLLTKLLLYSKSYIPEGLLNLSEVLNRFYDEDNQIGPWSNLN
jgi:hypothetical protein